MPYVEVPHRELRIFYCVNSIPPVGPGDAAPQYLNPNKPNVVLIHAATSSCETYSAQFSDPRLTNAFNLIAFDARLHGRTQGGPRKTHVMEDTANCLVAALDQLPLDNYCLVGEGFHGSNVCSWIAHKRPEKVKAMCLVSPGPFQCPTEISGSMIHEWLPVACQNKDGKGDGSGTIPDEQLQVINSYFFGAVQRQRDRREAYINHFQHRYGTEHQSSHDLRHIISFFGRKPMPPAVLSSIRCPVLLIQGEHDTIASPLRVAQQWQEALKGAKGGADLRIITGAPHLMLFTDYSIANRMILQFVTRSLNP